MEWRHYQTEIILLYVPLVLALYFELSRLGRDDDRAEIIWWYLTHIILMVTTTRIPMPSSSTTSCCRASEEREHAEARTGTAYS
jgi:hypothetical protein